jgi:hypothetical protein
MRTFVIILIVVVLGGLFLAQRRHDQKTATEQAVAQLTSTPRPVSEHDWAKHALDTTAKVTRQVEKQRQEDGNR